MLFAKTQLVPTTTTTTCYFWTNKGLTEVSWCLSSCTKCLLVLPTLIFFLLVEPIMISGVCSHGEVNPQRPRHQYSAALCCTSRTKTWTLCFTHAFKWGHRKREGRWSRNACQSRIGCRVLILWFKTTVMDCNEDQENSNNCSLCEFTHTHKQSCSQMRSAFSSRLACGRQNSFPSHQHSAQICSARQTIYRAGVQGEAAGGVRKTIKTSLRKTNIGS